MSSGLTLSNCNFDDLFLFLTLFDIFAMALVNWTEQLNWPRLARPVESKLRNCFVCLVIDMCFFLNIFKKSVVKNQLSTCSMFFIIFSLISLVFQRQLKKSYILLFYSVHSSFGIKTNYCFFYFPTFFNFSFKRCWILLSQLLTAEDQTKLKTVKREKKVINSEPQKIFCQWICPTVMDSGWYTES